MLLINEIVQGIFWLLMFHHFSLAFPEFSLIMWKIEEKKGKSGPIRRGLCWAVGVWSNSPIPKIKGIEYAHRNHSSYSPRKCKLWPGDTKECEKKIFSNFDMIFNGFPEFKKKFWEYQKMGNLTTFPTWYGLGLGPKAYGFWKLVSALLRSVSDERTHGRTDKHLTFLMVFILKFINNECSSCWQW